MSPSRTGPLTLRMMERFGSSMNSTRTWVTPGVARAAEHAVDLRELDRRRVHGCLDRCIAEERVCGGAARWAIASTAFGGAGACEGVRGSARPF